MVGRVCLFYPTDHIELSTHCPGVVSAPLWNSAESRFAGMLTVLDIIHLIQYYYRNASYDTAAADVETFRLESLRGIPTLPSTHPFRL